MKIRYISNKIGKTFILMKRLCIFLGLLFSYFSSSASGVERVDITAQKFLAASA